MRGYRALHLIAGDLDAKGELRGGSIRVSYVDLERNLASFDLAVLDGQPGIQRRRSDYRSYDLLSIGFKSEGEILRIPTRVRCVSRPNAGYTRDRRRAGEQTK